MKAYRQDVYRLHSYREDVRLSEDALFILNNPKPKRPVTRRVRVSKGKEGYGYGLK